MTPGFKILEHPSDLGIEARGASLAEAFQNAAAGLMSVIADTSTVGTHELREVNISAADRGQLLVKWLSEILYLYDGQQFVCKEFIIHHFDDTAINATVKGEKLSELKHRTKIDVKAITYHQLVVEEENNSGLVRVFIDI